MPISFFLKNKLHMRRDPGRRLLAGRRPSRLYLGFVWGFVRDIWNPFGLRDRGYMMLFGGLCAVGYVAFAFLPVSCATLLAAVIVLRPPSCSCRARRPASARPSPAST